MYKYGTLFYYCVSLRKPGIMECIRIRTSVPLQSFYCVGLLLVFCIIIIFFFIYPIFIHLNLQMSTYILFYLSTNGKTSLTNSWNNITFFPTYQCDCMGVLFSLYYYPIYLLPNALIFGSSTWNSISQHVPTIRVIGILLFFLHNTFFFKERI